MHHAEGLAPQSHDFTSPALSKPLCSVWWRFWRLIWQSLTLLLTTTLSHSQDVFTLKKKKKKVLPKCQRLTYFLVLGPIRVALYSWPNSRVSHLHTVWGKPLIRLHRCFSFHVNASLRTVDLWQRKVQICRHSVSFCSVLIDWVQSSADPLSSFFLSVAQH